MQVSVVTPDASFFEGEATFVALPALDGEMGIEPRHAPLIARLGHGVARVTEPSGQKVQIAVYGGFVKVQDDTVRVLAGGAALKTGGPDLAAAKAALEQAKEQLRQVRGQGKEGQSALAEAEEKVRRAHAYLELITH